MSEWASYDQPGRYDESFFLNGVAAAATTKQVLLFRVPINMRLEAVEAVSQAAVTGDGTDTKNLNIINKGQDGTGTTELGNIDLAAGNDLAAFDAKAFTMPASPVDINKGDVLAVEIEQVGTGVLLPEMLIYFEVSPR